MVQHVTAARQKEFNIGGIDNYLHLEQVIIKGASNNWFYAKQREEKSNTLHLLSALKTIFLESPLTRFRFP